MDKETHNSGIPEEESGNTEKETRQILKVALWAFLLNVALAALKGILAFYSGSLAVTAGAIDSISDAVASLAVYGGVKLSTRKTKTFPLGLYKIENLISVVVALFIFFAGYEIAVRIITPQTKPPEISFAVIVLLLVAVVAPFLFGHYAVAKGKKTESPGLIAEGRHRQTDALSTVVIWISALLHYFGAGFIVWGISIDRIAAAVVLIFIAGAGWELLSNGMRVLLDASINHETLQKIQKIIADHPAVMEVRTLIGRNVGRFRFLQAAVEMRTNDLQKAHRISRQIEQNIRKQIPHVERVLIHYEPASREVLRAAAPLSDPDGRIGAHFGEFPYFAVIQVRRSNHRIEEKNILDNPYTEIEKAKGIRVAEWLINKKIDVLILKEDIKNKGPGYVLSDAGVEVHVTDAENLEEAAQEIVKEQ